MRKADEIMTIFKKYGHELIDFEWGVYHATGRVKLRLKKSDFPTFDDAFLTRASKEKKSDLIYYHKDAGCRTEAHSKFYEGKPFFQMNI